MVSWFFIAISGYLLIATTGIMDKFLVSKVVRQPIAYAFFTAATGPFSLLLAVFGLKPLELAGYIVSLFSGLAFIAALYYLYSAMGQMSVSRVVPIQGGLVPLFTLVLAYIFLHERMAMVQIEAFFFLVLGAILISFKKEKGKWAAVAVRNSVLAAFFMALTSVLTKYVFDHSNFISGMVWTRLGFTFAALGIIMFKKNREIIFKAPKQAGVKNGVLYYSSRATGTIGGFLQNYAVSLGSVTIVNALQGVQFVFLLILTTFFSVYYPKVLKENITKETIALKLSAIVLISIGLLLLKG